MATPAPGRDQFVQVQIAPQALGGDSARQQVRVIVDREKPPPTRPLLQSFAWEKPLRIDDQSIPESYLWQTLAPFGLDPTAPVAVTSLATHLDVEDQRHVLLPLEEQKGFRLEESGAQCSNMPRSWPFRIGSIDASVINSPKVVYLRVHSMVRADAYSVLHTVAASMMRHWREDQDRGTLRLWLWSDFYGWRENASVEKPARSMSTIYLDAAVKERVVKQLRRFLESKDMYEHFGTTWKRVHLLHGPPGTGKTSFVQAVTAEMGRSLAKVTFTPRLTGETLEKMFTTLPDDCFLLLEDVDALFARRESVAGALDFSSVINALDGVATKPGLVVFLTSNFIDDLDWAMIRPARVDCYVPFPLPGRKELADALAVLAPEHRAEHEMLVDLIIRAKPTIAALQQYLFDCRQLDRGSILVHVDELLHGLAEQERRMRSSPPSNKT